MDKPLKDRLKEAMSERGIKFPKLEAQTGIPKERMYKWYPPQNSRISHEDAIIIQNWLDNYTQKPFLEQRREAKSEVDPDKEGITFIPISAQAGYAKRYLEPVFTKTLEKLYIPGMPYRGEKFRIWEVEGNSMEPTFKEHFHLLTEKVESESWHQIKEFYAYVVVTNEDVLLKRIKRSKQKDHWVLISDNNLYEPFLMPIAIVKELWIVKRKMDWEMSPPKRFEIDM